jgi:NAD(P)-dependent dehydrogenase (short-subunit alcohol dehydrogenase family)
MDLGLVGKVALVTAASEGLGYACATRLAEEGCAVVICGRRPDVLEEARSKLASAGHKVLAVPADLTDAAQLENLVLSPAQFDALTFW